jgi:hypothetical protein
LSLNLNTTHHHHHPTPIIIIIIIPTSQSGFALLGDRHQPSRERAAGEGTVQQGEENGHPSQCTGIVKS